MDRNMIIKVVRDEWQALYHNLSSEARMLRMQQWLVVICCLLLFGGTVGFMYTQGLENIGSGEQVMIRILSAAVLAAGLFFITLQQYNIRNCRKRVLQIEETFLVCRRYKARLSGWEKMQRWGAPKFVHQFPYYILLMLAVVVGFLFVHWYPRSSFLIGLYQQFFM
jgi:hypothetical protein